MLFASPRDINTNEKLLCDLLNKMESDTYIMKANSGLVAEAFEDYELNEWKSQQHIQSKLFWEKLEIDDPILMRGLYSLLKSEMLFTHIQFGNASLSEIHISLDAAHCYVLAQLRKMGKPNPTSIDAQDYVSDIFAEPRTGDRFFQDYYEDRIRNFHADNRFGAEPIPNFCVDDIWFLVRALKKLYYKLVTDEHLR